MSDYRSEDDPLIRALVERSECSYSSVYAWQCWCPSCATNILSVYEAISDPERRRNALPAAVVEKIERAMNSIGEVKHV